MALGTSGGLGFHHGSLFFEDSSSSRANERHQLTDPFILLPKSALSASCAVWCAEPAGPAGGRAVGWVCLRRSYSGCRLFCCGSHAASTRPLTHTHTHIHMRIQLDIYLPLLVGWRITLRNSQLPTCTPFVAQATQKAVGSLNCLTQTNIVFAVKRHAFLILDSSSRAQRTYPLFKDDNHGSRQGASPKESSLSTPSCQLL